MWPLAPRNSPCVRDLQQGNNQYNVVWLPWWRPRSLFAGGQIILFNTGVQQPRIRDKQMLDGRTGEKEAGRVDGTGSFLPSCGRPAPPVSALVCSCDVSSMGLTGFRVCRLWGLSAYFFMYLFFLRALSTARAAPSVLWWWPHPSLISSKLSSSSCRVFEAGSMRKRKIKIPLHS